MDRLNKECEATARVDTPPDSPPTAPSIGETLQLLVVPAEEPQAGSPRPLPILRTPPRSPFEDGMTEDLPLPDLPGETPPGVEATVSPPTDLNQEERSQKERTREEKEDSVHQDRTETVSISGTPPSVARLRLPTAAKKCPRKEFRGTAAQVARPRSPLRSQSTSQPSRRSGNSKPPSRT